MKILARFSVVAMVALGVLACNQVDRSGGGGGGTLPPKGKVLPVTSKIISVALAEDCSRAEAAAAKEAPSADMAAGAVAGDCAGPDCGGSFCQQTTMQLSFVAGDGTSAAKIKVVKVKLSNAKTGEAYGELMPRNPRNWGDNNYATWDENLAPAQKLQVMYDLTAPDWNKITGGKGRWGAQDTTFKVEVELDVAGKKQVVETSAEVMIEPEVVT